MKKIIFLIIAILYVTPMMAQQMVDPNKPDEQLTEEEAQIRINEWKRKVDNLQANLDALSNDISAMNQQMAQLQKDLKDCNDAIYAMLGATEADVNAFRENLGRIENRVREMKRMSDEQLSQLKAEIEGLDASLNELRKNKIALLPEFYNKIIDVARDIRDLRERANRQRNDMYVVGTWAKDRDCLWNIAGKDKIYNDPFMWPKIWQANTEQIRNPDIIHPGQKLVIPPAGPKNDEELRAERLYFRKKRAAAAARAAATSERTQQVDQKEAGSGN